MAGLLTRTKALVRQGNIRAARGGLTFKASSLIAKALHPDATPSVQVRLEAFKAFSAWTSDGMPRSGTPSP